MADFITNDHGASKLVVTCYESDGSTVINLTGYTIEFVVKPDNGDAKTLTGAIEDAAAGKASYTFKRGDIPTGASKINVDVVLIDSSGNEVTQKDTLVFTVRDRL